MDKGTRGELLDRLAGTIESVITSHPLRVAVDGPPAAGKTTLADELALLLRARGRKVIRASTESFHLPRAQRYRRGEFSPKANYHDSFDYDTLRRVLLAPLGLDGERRYQAAVYDIETDTAVSPPVTTASADAVLLLDGVFLLRPELIGRGPEHLRVRRIRADPGSRPDPGSGATRIHRRSRAALPHPLHPRPEALLRHGPPGRSRRHHRAQRRAPASRVASPTALTSTQDPRFSTGPDRRPGEKAPTIVGRPWQPGIVSRDNSLLPTQPAA